MPERRASRFALEVLFLIALAVAMTLANQPPLVIAGVMLLGWLIVALLEWAAWRDEPHYGSGLPPRYYVPQVSLPPRRPLEQVGSGYPAPEQRDEAPTWIASPSLRAEVLGDWPVAAPAPAGEDTQEEPPPEEAAAPVEPEPVAEAPSEPEPEPEPEPLPVAEPARRRRLWGRRGPSEDPDEAEDGWNVSEFPVEPEPTAAPGSGRTATHRIDPLAGAEGRRRRWHRDSDGNGAVAEVPARPAGPRVLPGRSKEED